MFSVRHQVLPVPVDSHSPACFPCLRVFKYVETLSDSVMPAQAGIQMPVLLRGVLNWPPALSGATTLFSIPFILAMNRFYHCVPRGIDRHA